MNKKLFKRWEEIQEAEGSLGPTEHAIQLAEETFREGRIAAYEGVDTVIRTVYESREARLKEAVKDGDGVKILKYEAGLSILAHILALIQNQFEDLK